MLRDSTTHFVCPSVRRSFRPLVRPSVTLNFFCFFCGLWPHCSCPNDGVTSIMAPAHPHATGVAVYLALLLNQVIPDRIYLIVSALLSRQNRNIQALMALPLAPFSILAAGYGHIKLPNLAYDVTETLQELLRQTGGNRLIIGVDTRLSDLFQRPDPCPGQPKMLLVR